MNKEAYMKEVFEILKQYDLDKQSKRVIYDQVNEVISQMDESNLINPHDFVNELFELNDLDPKFKKSYTSFSVTKTIIGIAFILLGFGVIFDFNDNVIIIVVISLVYLSMALKTIFSKKLYSFLFISILYGYYLSTTSYFVDMIGLPPLWQTLLAYFLVVIGLNIITNGMNKNVKKYKSKYQNKAYSSKTIDKENIHIVNKLSSTNVTFTDDVISFIQVDNSLGSTMIDLKNFQYNAGNLTINVANNLGAVEIQVSPDTMIVNSMSNTMGSVDTIVTNNRLPNTIYLIGDNKMGSVSAK